VPGEVETAGRREGTATTLVTLRVAPLLPSPHTGRVDVADLLEFVTDFDVLLVLACIYIFAIAGYAIVVSYLDAPERNRPRRRNS
jgi:uncharacterized membrane protein YqhA